MMALKIRLCGQSADSSIKQQALTTWITSNQCLLWYSKRYSMMGFNEF